MNLRRTFLHSRILPVLTCALLSSTFTHAATDDAAQRQLREDRERFQREVERQRTESQIQAERARQSAEQQRTADELARLRAQQDRQSTELRTLNETTRTLGAAPIRAPASYPSADPSPSVSFAPVATSTAAAITPDFSVTVLPDGNCVVYRKGLPAEVLSAAETEKAFRSLLTTKSKAPERQGTAP